MMAVVRVVNPSVSGMDARAGLAWPRKHRREGAIHDPPRGVKGATGFCNGLWGYSILKSP
ncbi:MAG TPA: hypothetical protein ENI94_02535 [Gammaproteobacteria bacterium]|nr:hypothetical protein [Gammaproteobacteria bacterium]